MYPFFMASGPSIKKKYKTKPFHTLTLYNLFAKLLKITLKPPSDNKFIIPYDIIAQSEELSGNENLNRNDSTSNTIVAGIFYLFEYVI